MRVSPAEASRLPQQQDAQQRCMLGVRPPSQQTRPQPRDNHGRGGTEVTGRGGGQREDETFSMRGLPCRHVTVVPCGFDRQGGRGSGRREHFYFLIAVSGEKCPALTQRRSSGRGMPPRTGYFCPPLRLVMNWQLSVQSFWFSRILEVAQPSILLLFLRHGQTLRRGSSAQVRSHTLAVTLRKVHTPNSPKPEQHTTEELVSPGMRHFAPTTRTS